MISNPFSRKSPPDEAQPHPLALPLENQSRLSFCSSVKPVKVKQWFDDLPITDYQLVATKLYRALPELSRVKLSNASRAEILEHIRPLVLNCVAAIAAPLTKKPLALSEKEKKTALIAQALLKHLSVAYARLVVNVLADKKITDSAKASYIHRALLVLSLLLKNNYQLYTPVPDFFWHLNNGLYRLACKSNLNRINVTDSFNTSYSGNCDHNYLTSLALTCARPLHLRAAEIEQLFSVLHAWVKQINLAPFQSEQPALFAVISDSDQQPDYTDTFDTDKLQASGLQFDFSALLTQLEKINQQTSGNKGPVASSLNQHLMNHWGARVRRQNERVACNAELEICISLSAIHDQLTKGAKFEDFVAGSASSSGMVLTTNWDEVAIENEPPLTLDTASQTYYLTVTNTGQKGFQLQCGDSAPRKLQAGELIGFREAGKRNWQLAVVRWIKRSEKQGIQCGVMMIGRRLEAFGASTETESGRDSDYLRVLLVKEGTEDGKASLITPNAVFSERYPITLKKRGESNRVLISKRLSSSGSYCQYRFSKPQ